MFKKDDIVVQIGVLNKWRILEVRNSSYRVDQVCCSGHYTSTFDKSWVDHDFVKVGEYAWYGEKEEEDDAV